MSISDERVVLPFGSMEPDEYVAAFRSAVLEVMLLIFERREIDLDEEQLFALSLLTRAARDCQLQSGALNLPFLPDS